MNLVFGMKLSINALNKEVFFLFFLFAFVSAVLVFFGVRDLSLPLSDTYANTDGRMTIAIFKSILDGECGFSGIITTDRLAAPFGFSSFDFPMPMFSVILFIKLLSIFSNDPVVVFNLFIIFSFFANAFVMYIVLRKLSVLPLLAVAVAILYTFLPFHFFRFGHTFYIGYFFIPIWVYVALKLMDRDDAFLSLKKTSEAISSVKSWIVLLLLALSSTWNFYYSFFFSLMLLFILFYYVVHRVYKDNYKKLFVVFLAIVLPFFLNMLPYKYMQHEEGVNFQVAQRSPIESEIYGLKISQLLLPVTYHRIDSWERLKDSYNKSSVLFNESQDATLGLVASVGFLSMIVFVFFRRLAINFKYVYYLSQFNLFSLLLATVGGFSVIFAFFVTPDIRAYNRISIFIATFSLIVFAVVAHYYLSRVAISKVKLAILFLVFMLFAMYDLTPKNMFFGTWPNAFSQFVSDRNFVRELEQELLDVQNPMIAELPYMPYPENGPIEKLKDYEQILGYLHSDAIKWSYGAVKGREADGWWKSLASLTLENQVLSLQKAGFSGLLVDRRGYNDNGFEVERQLSDLLHQAPKISENGLLIFFRLKPDTLRYIDMPPIYKGFYEWEGPVGSFRWASKNANITFFCYGNEVCIKNISFTMSSLTPRNIVFNLDGDVLDETEISPVGRYVSLSLNLKPGKNVLKFNASGSPVVPGGSDNRDLVFNIKGVTLK